MCISDVILNEALKLEVEALCSENATLKAELAQQPTNSKSIQCQHDHVVNNNPVKGARVCVDCGEQL